MAVPRFGGVGEGAEPGDFSFGVRSELGLRVDFGEFAEDRLVFMGDNLAILDFGRRLLGVEDADLDDGGVIVLLWTAHLSPVDPRVETIRLHLHLSSAHFSQRHSLHCLYLCV